jgi:ATP-binding cassette subfamily C protein
MVKMKSLPLAEPLSHAFQLCRRHFVFAAIFSGIINLLYIVPTLYMLQVYDRVIPARGLMTLLFLTLILLVALGVGSQFDRIRMRLLLRASIQIEDTLTPTLLDATLGRPELPEAKRAMRDFDAVKQLLTSPAMLALFDAPWAPIYLIIAFLLHPLIGALALGAAIVMPLIAWGNERATRPRLDRAQDYAGGVYAEHEALLTGAESVRALGMRRAMVSRQVGARKTILALQADAGLAGSNYYSASKFARQALQSLGLGLGALLAVDNQISAGAVFASSFLISRAISPVEQLIGTWKTIVRARSGLNSLSRLLHVTAIPRTQTILPAPRGAIELDQVTVLNEARDGAILNSISLRAEPGEVVAIVGPSGAGKSTLARIIAGGLIGDRGTVRIDGADTRDWDPERLARHIGFMPQDSRLFAGTIKENVCRFANQIESDMEAVDRKVIEAAEKSNAHWLILTLARGYDHVLGTGGQGLSSGQAQRIALARAVYNSPSVLVLDEPNSHLDGDGDELLRASLARLKAEGMTIFVVSHSRTILPVVDKILLLRDGRVEAYGGRDEILARMTPASIPSVVRRVAQA